MGRFRVRMGLGVVGAMLLASLPGCSGETEIAPARPKRGSLGEELYGALCDRMGAQNIPEDLTGASYRSLCHPEADPKGVLVASSTVDETKIPGGLGSHDGAERLVAFARRRGEVVAAFQAMIPEEALADELLGVLQRMTHLYTDGTLPALTRALGRWAQGVDEPRENELREALVRVGAREGYRSPAISLGPLPGLFRYPRWRELADATLPLLGRDWTPNLLEHPSEETHVGVAHGALDDLSKTLGHELQAASWWSNEGRWTARWDASVGLTRFSRPRTPLESATALLLTEDPSFSDGAPRFLVLRDVRGVARVAAGKAGLPPFVDRDWDGLPDLDDRGRWIASQGPGVPPPFLPKGTQPSSYRHDAFGRPMAEDETLLYDYGDSSRTVGAALLRELRGLVRGGPAETRETLVDALAGLVAVLGPRDRQKVATKVFSPGTSSPTVVTYKGFHPESSPLVDLVHAMGVVAAHPNSDALLALVHHLFSNDEPRLAAVVSAFQSVQAVADALPSARLPKNSKLARDLVEALGRIASVTDARGKPVLLEGVLRALTDPRTANLGPAFESFLRFNDTYDYNRLDLNGPAMNVTTGLLGGPPSHPVDASEPARGANRSIFHRFLQMMHDTRGVSACNRPGAIVKARLDVPVFGQTDLSIPDTLGLRQAWGKGSFGECEVFKMDDLATFFLRSIVGRAEYVLRDKKLRDGVLGIGATTVHILEQSSDITGYQPPGTTDSNRRTGFWTEASSRTLLTRPEWLGRGLFLAKGVGAPHVPARADAFSKAVNPPHAGTILCPKREVADPLSPSDPNFTPGGKIFLPVCQEGDWLDQRDVGTNFALEQFNFFESVAPLLRPFVELGKEDLLLDLFDVLAYHYADDSGSDEECRFGPEGSPRARCSREGLVRFEPVLAEGFKSLYPAVRELIVTLTAPDTGTVPKFPLACGVRTGKDETCERRDGDAVEVLAAVLRAMTDPGEAARFSVQGASTGRRLRPARTPASRSMTPAELWLDALVRMDDALEAYAKENPSEADRVSQWRRARSQAADQFLTTEDKGAYRRFANRQMPMLAAHLLRWTREELGARCVEWPQEGCSFASKGIEESLVQTLAGPLFAQGMDLFDILRKDPRALEEIQYALAYVTGTTGPEGMTAATLVWFLDGVQAMADRRSAEPLVRFAARILKEEPSGGASTLVEASVDVLARLSVSAPLGRASFGVLDEIDPRQALLRMARHATAAVPPNDVLARGLESPTFSTPIEALGDVLLQVNRDKPAAMGPLLEEDYRVFSRRVAEFLLDRERGLEQLYAIVRQATRSP